METLYIIESVDHPKFPYRLTIRQGEKVLLALRVQDRWPGQGRHIFCIREEGRDWPGPEAELERVPVIAMKRLGKRLVLVLDRPRKKRCDFLFLKKRYKEREGEYEQIFWRTPKVLRLRRPRVRLSPSRGGLSILIDVNERYPWRFAGYEVERAELPVGDYALKGGEGVLAVVERKTFENLLADFGRMPIFHQQLTELSAYRYAALVIEAEYADFLKPEKLPAFSPAFCAKAIAEIYALHPGLTVVFAGNRKLASQWTMRFFEAVKSHIEDRPDEKIFKMMEGYTRYGQLRGGISFEIRRVVLEELPSRFTIGMVRERFQDIPYQTIARILQYLKKKGLIVCRGRGPGSYWEKV